MIISSHLLELLFRRSPQNAAFNGLRSERGLKAIRNQYAELRQWLKLSHRLARKGLLTRTEGALHESIFARNHEIFRLEFRLIHDCILAQRKAMVNGLRSERGLKASRNQYAELRQWLKLSHRLARKGLLTRTEGALDESIFARNHEIFRLEFRLIHDCILAQRKAMVNGLRSERGLKASRNQYAELRQWLKLSHRLARKGLLTRTEGALDESIFARNHEIFRLEFRSIRDRILAQRKATASFKRTSHQG